MTQYLLFWLLSAVTLGAAVGGLHVVYRLLGSDFGLGGFGREAAVLLIASALQAGVFYVAWSVYEPGTPQRLLTFLRAGSIVLVGGVYKLTHPLDMDAVEIAVLIVTQALLLIVWLLTTA